MPNAKTRINTGFVISGIGRAMSPVSEITRNGQTTYNRPMTERNRMRTARYVYGDYDPRSLRGQIIEHHIGKHPQKRRKPQRVGLYKGEHSVKHHSKQSKKHVNQYIRPDWY